MLRDPSLIPLSHDHHHALSLCVLANRSLAADGSAGNVAREAGKIVQRFDSDLHRHFDIEERILFPAVTPFPELHNLIAELIGEHRRLADLVSELRATPERHVIEQFCLLLRQHVRKEENGLFQAIQRLLSRERLDELGAQLASREPSVCDIAGTRT